LKEVVVAQHQIYYPLHVPLNGESMQGTGVKQNLYQL